MQEDKIVVGLDIGTTKVSVTVAKKDKHGLLEVLGSSEVPCNDGVSDGVVSNVARTEKAIKEAIVKAENASQIDIGSVIVGVSGKYIKSFMREGGLTRKSTDTEISADDVERLTNDMYRIVTPDGTKIIHVIPQTYSVDYEGGYKDPVGMSGVRLDADFLLITDKSNAVNNIIRSVERAGLEVEKLVLKPIASSMAVLSKEEKEAGVVMVDIGGGTTDIAIYHEGILRHTAVLPFGGDVITSDIKQGCSVMTDQAERLKVKFGKSLPEEAAENEIISIPGFRNRASKEISTKNLASIISARMDDIIELIVAEISRSKYADKLSAGIVVTGGTADLQNIKQLMEYRTGFETRIGYANEFLGKIASEEDKKTKRAVCIGLVLSGFHEIDERMEAYRNTENSQQSKITDYNDSTDKKGENIFSSFLRKTKELLIDDFEE